MKPLTIEINGTGTHNRGAELMAIAIADRLRATFPGVRLVVPSQFGSQADRKKYGFLTTWEFAGRAGAVRTMLASMAWRGRSDVINPAQVDIVLDASGFAFSDQWGASRPQKLVRIMSRSYRRHQKLILLPQALGPFEKPDVADWSRKMFSRASLVFARDSHSHACAIKLAPREVLRQFPDFTVSVSPNLPSSVSIPERFCAIVPNVRMMDKTSTGEDYLNFLRHAIDSMEQAGMNPVIVLHDADEDRAVLGMMGGKYSQLPVLTHPDPRVLKGMLGRADFVIGSRFHALVSSLSQGVPCIGAGWSHKYPELFRDFACPELLLADLSDRSALSDLIARLRNDDERAKVSARVSAAADELKSRTNEMWAQVEAEIRAAKQS